MHVEDIKAALRKQGWTLASIAKELDIGPSAVSHALTRQRSRRIEQVIASKLGLSPHEIWPQRYKRGKVSHAPICQQTGSHPISQAQRLDSKTLSLAGPAGRGHSLGSSQ
ncbi:MAG: helix-turn-helix domain-containing protein [Elainellaceae cyanobacterium]